jgi:peroxiredoxin
MAKIRFTYLLVGVLGLLCSVLGQSAEAPPANLGKKVANFTLTDPRDQSKVSLSDFKDRKAVVVIFTGTDCPISNAFLPRLAMLSKEYAPKGVQFLAINANVQDTPDKIAAHALKYEVPFPVLRDVGNVVADDMQATRMSEAFLLDTTGAIRYRGRIDDQFGQGYQRPQPTRRDLAVAIDELLANKEVTQPTTLVAGCRIGRAIKPKADGAVTYAKHVSRILQKNCQECHRPGQIGPMALLNYDQAVAWSETIREVVRDGFMPPWFADPQHGKFANDRHLPAEEREQLLAWIDQGCPRGDDKDAPPPRTFNSDWSIGKPDLILSMKEEFDVPATAPREGVPYQYFTVDTGFTEDHWVQEAEARAGAPEAVHHIIVFILPPGKTFHPDRPGNTVLCGVAPGDTALHLPPGFAKRIPAGSKLIFQMHYTPNGKATKDRSSIGLVFAKQPPEREARTVAVLNASFRIPAGNENFQVESWHPFSQDVILLGFMPHMHLRGKDFLYEAIPPGGQKETLLSVPRFNFNWQSSYRLEKPYHLLKGSKVHCIAHFDNSAKNPNNPDPNVPVSWGDQTWEEMMIGWMEFAYDRKPE